MAVASWETGLVGRHETRPLMRLEPGLMKTGASVRSLSATVTTCNVVIMSGSIGTKLAGANVWPRPGGDLTTFVDCRGADAQS